MPKWLTDTSLCRIPVICVMIYAGIGFSLIVYMAALQSVPKELYEAATMDGARFLPQVCEPSRCPCCRPPPFICVLCG